MFQDHESRLTESAEAYGKSPWESDHWSRLQELFHLAGTAPPGERTRILRNACADPALVERVIELLAASSDEPAPADGVSETVPLGTRVGPYALLRHLGTGGLGSVYLAERMVGGAVQKCALKVLSMHAAGPQFESRFQREQQILATLNHPHITRLLDAGFSETNQPYLIMEYVDGVDLVRYCDEQKLSVAARLEVFLQICDAVAYAHRNLTVHLDLKPSNVLVSKEGEVKLLDFGTSKLIDPDSALTTTILATPAYAAPEQLRNEPVTTACDIYSLGAMLFEVLSGQRPFQNASVAMVVERAFQEQEPGTVTNAVTKESAEARGMSEARLKQLLHGDLATIVSRCLHSRPRDRYPYVDALAEDIRRYLTGLPVLTRRQTTRYRLAKFVRRNRNAVTATVLAAVTIAASLSYAAIRQHQALRDANRAVQMQTFMSQLFKLANTNYMGKPAATVPEFLQLGAKVLPEMIRDPADQRAAALSLAESMYNNTDYKDAQPALARIINEAKAAKDLPLEAEAEAYTGRVAYKLGDMQASKTLSDHAVQLAGNRGVVPAVRILIDEFYLEDRYEQDLATDDDVKLARAAVREAHSAGVPENELASADLTLSYVLERKGQLQEQMKLTEEVLAIYRREPYAVCDAAAAATQLGFLRQQTDELQGSVDAFRAAYEGYRQCAGDDNRDTLEAAGYLALAMVPAKQTKPAIPLLEATIPRLEAAAGRDSLQLKGPLLALARSYLAEGQFAQSEATAARLFHLVNGKINPMSTQMGAYQSVWARALQGQGKYPEALVHANLAEESYLGADSNLPASKDNAAKTHQLMLDLRAKVSH
jgi:serine/threonine protein kinase